MGTIRKKQLVYWLALALLAYVGIQYLSSPRYLGKFWGAALIAWLSALITLGTLAIGSRRPNSARPPRLGPGPSREAVAKKLAEIEAEMKRVGLWQDEPLARGQLDFKTAFAGDTMSIDQWLQFVFIPRVREIIARNEPFPPASSVAPRVLREFDASSYDITELHMRLYEFDRMFD